MAELPFQTRFPGLRGNHTSRDSLDVWPFGDDPHRPMFCTACGIRGHNMGRSGPVVDH
jgi:hypothetical protein